MDWINETPGHHAKMETFRNFIAASAKVPLLRHSIVCDARGGWKLPATSRKSSNWKWFMFFRALHAINNNYSWRRCHHKCNHRRHESFIYSIPMPVDWTIFRSDEFHSALMGWWCGQPVALRPYQRCLRTSYSHHSVNSRIWTTHTLIIHHMYLQFTYMTQDQQILCNEIAISSFWRKPKIAKSIIFYFIERIQCINYASACGICWLLFGYIVRFSIHNRWLGMVCAIRHHIRTQCQTQSTWCKCICFGCFCFSNVILADFIRYFPFSGYFFQVPLQIDCYAVFVQCTHLLTHCSYSDRIILTIFQWHRACRHRSINRTTGFTRWFASPSVSGQVDEILCIYIGQWSQFSDLLNKSMHTTYMQTKNETVDFFCWDMETINWLWLLCYVAMTQADRMYTIM